MNRELLERPFAPAQIRQRKGRNGLLDYVEGHSVIQRLNEALDGAWSFEIVHHEVREEEVLVIGRLTAEGITKMAFGGSQVTRERESGALISISDDLKSASTDAMKKCATFLGVGLHLYADKPLVGRTAAMRAGGALPPGTPPARPASPLPPPRPSPNGNGAGPRPPTGDGGASPNGDRATDRQLEAIVSIGRGKGLAPADVEVMSLRAFNRKPGALTRSEASSLRARPISWMPAGAERHRLSRAATRSDPT